MANNCCETEVLFNLAQSNSQTCNFDVSKLFSSRLVCVFVDKQVVTAVTKFKRNFLIFYSTGKMFKRNVCTDLGIYLLYLSALSVGMSDD